MADDAAKFADTVKNLLNMKPKPHEGAKAEENGDNPKAVPTRSGQQRAKPDQEMDDPTKRTRKG